ncbi:MAG: type II secretion system protein N [Parvularculaceae bacterium]|nr:type II secretion system protein N [Parvularculaceae bacterium]
MVLLKAFTALIAPVPLPQPLAAEIELAPDYQLVASSASSHPFGVGLAAGNIPDVSSLKESALNLRLYGTWIGTDGRAAIISLDGAPQKKVAVGEEIASGVRLDDVQDEFVIINNQGAREAAMIINRKVVIRSPDMATKANDILETPPAGIALRDAPESEDLQQSANLPDLANFDTGNYSEAADATGPDETD